MPPKRAALPTKERTLFQRLIQEYETKKYKLGLKTADTILKKFPDHGETVAMKGLLLGSTNRREEGIELAKKGVRLDLTSFICWHALGILHRQDKNYEEAIKCYTQALRIEGGGNINLLRESAFLQLQLRNYVPMVENRLTLLRMQPHLRINWVGLAVAHHLAGSLEAAHTKNVFSISTERWAKRLVDMTSPYPTTTAPANGDGRAPREASIGVGTVYDSNAFGGNAYSRDDAAQSAPLRSHYFLSRDEILKGVANRFVHSSAYLYFYAGMALASLLTVVISLTSDCPGTLFYGLELAINLLLIAEVGIRLVAFGKQFWKSTYNIVDLGLVLLCAVTLAVIFFHHECSPFRRGPSYPDDEERSTGRSGKGEELLDSILLIGRNVVQALRLVSIVRRSGSNVTSRPTRIEIGNRPYSFDLDLEDEGAMARDRIRIGEEERAPLFDAEDDEL